MNDTDVAGGKLAAMTTAQLRSDDLDAIGAQFDEEVVEQDWGAREMCLNDPDGSRLRLGMSRA